VSKLVLSRQEGSAQSRRSRARWPGRRGPPADIRRALDTTDDSRRCGLKPEREVTVQSPEDGVVAEVFATEGDKVARRQPLFLVSSAAIDSEARGHYPTGAIHEKVGEQPARGRRRHEPYQAAARASRAQTPWRPRKAARGSSPSEARSPGRSVTSRRRT